ncbi:hypothetical protein AB837_00602 [bacterium AB1]|nr:hypothetical protein AB837_00602 [bacterium AB1]
MKIEEVKKCEDFSLLHEEIVSGVRFFKERCPGEVSIFDTMDFSRKDEFISDYIEFIENEQNKNDPIILFKGETLTTYSVFVKEKGYEMSNKFIEYINCMNIELFKSHTENILKSKQHFSNLFKVSFSSQKEYELEYSKILPDLKKNYDFNVSEHSKKVKKACQDFVDYFQKK